MAKQPRLAAGRARALGLPTRGTTNPNRLRRVDNYVAYRCAELLRQAAEPLVIDLGYGATPVTAIELRGRLAAAGDAPHGHGHDQPDQQIDWKTPPEHGA